MGVGGQQAHMKAYPIVVIHERNSWKCGLFAFVVEKQPNDPGALWCLLFPQKCVTCPVKTLNLVT